MFFILFASSNDNENVLTVELHTAVVRALINSRRRNQGHHSALSSLVPLTLRLAVFSEHSHPVDRLHRTRRLGSPHAQTMRHHLLMWIVRS